VSRAFAVGDVHGFVDTLAARLHEAGLVAHDRRWCGGDATVWFTGDLADRGPAGAETIDLVMRLGEEAEAGGGAVRCLLGNHDLLLLAVARFGDFQTSSPRGSLREDWIANGGRERDVELLGERHLDWLAGLPALARHGTTLLAHCDSTLYLELGGSIEEVNEAVSSVLAGDEVRSWRRLNGLLWRRNELRELDQARSFLDRFGCDRLVHGHTPIPYVTGAEPATVTEPLEYANGLCVNVDGGIYTGGPGFVFPLE
jgi:hypothetical protein